MRSLQKADSLVLNDARDRIEDSGWDDAWSKVVANVWDSVWGHVLGSVEGSVCDSSRASVWSAAVEYAWTIICDTE